MDTNAVIALFADDDGVKSRLREADAVFLSSVALGELFYGAHKSRRVRENSERLEAFAARNTVLPADLGVSKVYGQIKTELRSKGTPIPENDLWIAATALHHGLQLLSKDQHFDALGTVELVGW